ncbi:MAG: phage terminase small subunit P27 family [Lachnotalea sp.]
MENEIHKAIKKIKPIPCPKWLNDIAKKEWRRVAKIFAEEGKEFTEKDTKAFEAYCINYAKWKKCEEVIDTKGFTMEVGDNGYEQQRPEVSIANKAQTELRAWAKELGLTPAARQRMKTANLGDEGIDPELDQMVAHD